MCTNVLVGKGRKEKVLGKKECSWVSFEKSTSVFVGRALKRVFLLCVFLH